MYPQMPAMRNPTINTKGTATIVSFNALGDSVVARAEM